MGKFVLLTVLLALVVMINCSAEDVKNDKIVPQKDLHTTNNNNNDNKKKIKETSESVLDSTS